MHVHRKLRLGHCEKLDDAALRLLAAYRRAPPGPSADVAASCTASANQVLPTLTPPASSDAEMEMGSMTTRAPTIAQKEGTLAAEQGCHGSRDVKRGQRAAQQLSSAEALLLLQHETHDREDDMDDDLASLPGGFMAGLSRACFSIKCMVAAIFVPAGLLQYSSWVS